MLSVNGKIYLTGEKVVIGRHCKACRVWWNYETTVGAPDEWRRYCPVCMDTIAEAVWASTSITVDMEEVRLLLTERWGKRVSVDDVQCLQDKCQQAIINVAGFDTDYIREAVQYAFQEDDKQADAEQPLINDRQPCDASNS